MPSDSHPGETVLIVDDTPANLSVLLQCLSDAHYHVLVAEDGEEALELVQRRQPDLILLDVMMPGIDGFETCRQLKASPHAADVPVIFMTALTETDQKLAGFEAGAVDYITKPIQHEEALARVSTHLTLRRLNRRLREELELKQRFMRIASHDLRNPLCLLTFASAVARRRLDQPEAITSQLDEIDESVSQMQDIIDTFLELKETDDGKPLPPLPLIEATVRQYHTVAATKDQQLDLVLPDKTLPLVRGRTSTVFQVLSNLISNALKFSPSGSKVTVTVSTPSPAAVRITVLDEGPGVPIAERDQLFKDNARLSPRPTGGEDSHGFGLSIARQLVEQAGGRIGADFPPSGGSAFWAELSCA